VSNLTWKVAGVLGLRGDEWGEEESHFSRNVYIGVGLWAGKWFLVVGKCPIDFGYLVFMQIISCHFMYRKREVVVGCLA
jgi:hypothetical protein